MSEELKSRGYKGIVIGIVVVAVVIIVLFIPMIPISVAYDELEPYERKCTYVVDDRNLEEKLGFFDFYVQSDVTVRNTDKYGGTFQVFHRLDDIHGVFGTHTDSFHLGAGESHTSTATFDTSWGQDTMGTYSVTAPTVVDEQLVTKHKTVYKSLVEILLYS